MKRVFTLLMVFAAMATGTKVMAQDPYAVYNNGTLTFYCDGNEYTQTGDIYYVGANSGGNSPGWVKEHSSQITKVVFDSSFQNAWPTTMAFWFYNCQKLKTIVGIENVNTNGVTDMRCVFAGCSQLKSSLDLSGWDTSNVTDMSLMFNLCYELPSLNVSGWNTSKVTNMRSLFGACLKLTTLDVTDWDTSKVDSMGLVFSACYALESIDVSKWNTIKVCDMEAMFADCHSLKTLDLNNWNTYNVDNMSYMFMNCNNLTTIYCGDGWTAEHVASENMFKGCINLVGGKGTTYDENHVKRSYAHIDGGPDNPGYLTAYEAYDLWIAGTQVTNVNCHSIPYEGVDFDPDTNTLTLNNASISIDEPRNFCVSNEIADLVVVVRGYNTIESIQHSALFTQYNAHFKGNGTLHLKGSDTGLYCSQNSYSITVSDGIKLICEGEQGAGFIGAYSDRLNIWRTTLNIMGACTIEAKAGSSSSGCITDIKQIESQDGYTITAPTGAVFNSSKHAV